MSNNIGQKLLQMKEHIEKSKTEAARIEGQIQGLENQRAQEFGCPTDAEAEEYIRELESDVATLEQELQAGVQEVKKELGWIHS
jgi:hypothetical protein